MCDNKCKFENVLIKITNRTPPLCVNVFRCMSEKDCCFYQAKKKKNENVREPSSSNNNSNNSNNNNNKNSISSGIWITRSGWIIYSRLLRIIKVTMRLKNWYHFWVTLKFIFRWSSDGSSMDARSPCSQISNIKLQIHSISDTHLGSSRSQQRWNNSSLYVSDRGRPQSLRSVGRSIYLESRYLPSE